VLSATIDWNYSSYSSVYGQAFFVGRLFEGCSTWFAKLLRAVVDFLAKYDWVIALNSSGSQGWHETKSGAPR
jgi:hypothetical protein